ncbi:uncharacterized protein HMPREF1541_07510 [Cyphellophora europaea CBS 101466]|uniref:Uncharacterized protein n=1 Tax=Cyphellophora europaea (strain CBS 101466) TaxID=1220924 RepID=W2RN69_CYPE1|nr:uncharacterized protein HMPREF1541_07510 [Cyphellophora europaea CBS 101466]ETN37887.1 hypothetical protein HMPREF1541_07510 [Cyphellophora europaea CBS 101466]
MAGDPSSISPTPQRASDSVLSSNGQNTRQQRLLRLRNDRFPAKPAHTACLNPRRSNLNRTTDDHSGGSSPPTRSQENIALPKPRRHGKGLHPTSSISILEEISNSIRSKSLGSHSDNDTRKPIPIFQDTPERPLLGPSPYTSSPLEGPYSSPVESPFHFDGIHDSFRKMGLREVSGNVRKAPSTEVSPWSSGLKPARRRPASAAAPARYNSEEYIQRIEQELDLAQGSVYSPNTNRLWKDKLKVVQAENDVLRQELADVKATFEAEVQKAIQHKAASEATLRRRIRSLEEEAEQKDCVIRDLETMHDKKRLDQGTLETLKATIERLEFDKYGLEQANHNMSKRNEVLTHLLAFSPTKSQQTFELATPSRASKHNRPRSLLLPRISSSPTHTHPHRPRSLAESPASGKSFDHSRHGSSPLSPAVSETYSRLPLRPEIPRSQSMLPYPASHSRSSTLASCVSMSPTGDHRPSSSSSSTRHSRQASNRGPRRYVPGSTQLKPLLLPTLTRDFGALSSTSPLVSPSRSIRRDFTDESIDPTTMFLSKSPTGYESDAEHSTADSYVDYRQRESARHLTYQSLEGVLDAEDSKQVVTDDLTVTELLDAGKGHRVCHIIGLGIKSPASVEDADRTILPPENIGARGLAGGLDEDISQHLDMSSPGSMAADVELPKPLRLSASTRAGAVGCAPADAINHFSDSPNPDLLGGHPRKRKRMSNPPDIQDPFTLPRTIDKGTDARPLNGTETPPTKSRPPSLSLLSPHRARAPLKILERKNFGVKPIAVVTIKTIYGTLSKCTALIRHFKSDPWALARRVIANAWHCNWAILGKLSWWVLGLFLGPSTKQQQPKTWEWEDYDGEAIADRHCRRKSKPMPPEQQSLLRDEARASTARRVDIHPPKEAAYTERSNGTTTPREKQGWGKSMFLWAKFSTAIVLAVGGAVVKGPGEMMRDTDVRRASRKSKEYRRVSTSSEDSDVVDTSAVDFEMQDMRPRPQGNELRRRRSRKQDVGSPPPAARASLARELQSDNMSSSPPVSSSPAIGSFRFGRKQTYDFNISDGTEVDAKTLKPSKTGRINIEDIFDYSNAGTPTKAVGGHEE